MTEQFIVTRTGLIKIQNHPMSKRKASTQKQSKTTKRARTGSRPVQAAFTRSVEWKNFDAQNNTRIVAAQSASTIVSIFNADQGTAPNEHVGRSVKAGSLAYNFTASFAATTAGNSPVRLAIVYDRQPNASLPTVTDVWVTDTIDTMPNKNNKKRFKVLVDEKSEGLSAAGPSTLYLSGFRKFKNPLETYYNNTNGGTIADITTGSYVAFVWQNGNIITASPTSSLFTRVTYMDA